MLAKSPKQLFYLADWLPPDFGAVGQYATLFAREIAESGSHHVCLIGLTSGQSRKEELNHLDNLCAPRGPIFIFLSPFIYG